MPFGRAASVSWLVLEFPPSHEGSWRRKIGMTVSLYSNRGANANTRRPS